MKELRLLKRWRRFHRSVNYVEYQEQERMRGPIAFSSFMLRELLLRKHYNKRLQYLESRISQSSCVPKRDFTAYFDDAERFNEQKCLALFRFKLGEINTMMDLLGLNGMTFPLPNPAKYTGKEGFLLLLTHLTRASDSFVSQRRGSRMVPYRPARSSPTKFADGFITRGLVRCYFEELSY